MLMIRLSRKRRRDPIFQSSTAAKTKYLSGAHAPRLRVRDDDVILEVSVQDLYDRLPDYDERKQIIAVDYLASVDGFRVMIQLTVARLFGINVCQHCPRCNSNESNSPCQDMFGSSATAEGGLFWSRGCCLHVYRSSEVYGKFTCSLPSFRAVLTPTY